MKITVENLGVIKKGSVEISENGGMTIFAGANNSGKSYMSYLVYGVYRKLLEYDFDVLQKDELISAQFYAELFGKKDFYFPFEFSDIKQFSKCYFFPSERGTLNQIAKEVINEKAARHDYFRQVINQFESTNGLKEKLQTYFVPRYALPISDYIYWVFDIEEAVQQPKTRYVNLADELELFFGWKC